MNMQANNRYMIANYLHGIKNKRLWVILLFANILSLPYGIFTITFFHTDSKYSLFITGLALVVNVIMAMVIPFIQFDYCYDKLKVDNAYSLPMTRKQKFLSDFFSGLTIIIGSYIVQVILSYIMSAIFFIFGKKIEMDWYYNQRLEMAGSPWWYENLAKILVIIFLIQIFLYVLTTFVLACTGSIFEAITASIYINILIPSTIYMIYLLIKGQMYGMDYFDSVREIIYRTSPFGGFIYLVNNQFTDHGIVSWVVVTMIMIILLGTLSYIIMKNRKAESVGKPFVIRAFYHSILFAVILHIGVLASNTSNSLFSFITITLIAYLMIDTITNRGIKRIKSSVIRYCTIVGTGLIFILTLNKTNCFGRAYHVAKAEDVKSITLTYSGLFQEDYEILSVPITSKDVIEQMLQIQRDVIEKYKVGCKENGNFFEWKVTNPAPIYRTDVRTPMIKEIKISVDTKNGLGYKREYYIDYETMLKLCEVELSDNYIKERIKRLRDDASSLSISDAYNLNRKSVVSNREGEPSALLDEFFECLEADLKETSMEEYLRPSEPIRCIAYMDMHMKEIKILGSYQRTIAFLEKINAIPDMMNEDYRNIFNSEQCIIFNKDESRLEEEYCTSNPNGGWTRGGYEIKDFDDDVLEIMKNSRRQYCSEVACYELNVGGRVFMIPNEYTDTVERILKGNVREI